MFNDRFTQVLNAAGLEMLFPNSQVRTRTIDKAMIGTSASVGGAIVLVTKLVGTSLLVLAGLFVIG